MAIGTFFPRYSAVYADDAGLGKQGSPVCYFGKDHEPSLFYRIASILLILFDLGHTLGFRQADPKWGIDSLIQSMRSVHFNAIGSERTYWDLFVGFGLFVTALMVLASVIAGQLGSFQRQRLRVCALARGIRSLLASSLFLSCLFLLVQVIFSIAILVCPTLAAWLSGNP